jgi:two-component sensor histidine kinase
VNARTLTTCGEVLRSGRRVIVSDVTKCEFMRGSDDQAFFVRGGIRACQSTPLLSRSGRLMGAFSTHWRTVHAPSERDLRLLDILARQAADLLERMLAEERLRESDRRKEEFLATLAHELRNPLAPILNAVQYLEIAAPVAPEMRWARDVIVRQTTHLTRLVDDLLDVSRINHARLEIRKERVDLARVLQTAVETTQPFLEQRCQMLRVDRGAEGLTVDADPMRLSQVFANLINNAAKFSSAGGVVELIVESRGDVVDVRVRDHGIGIEASELPESSISSDAFGRRTCTIREGSVSGSRSSSVSSRCTVEPSAPRAQGPGLGSEFTYGSRSRRRSPTRPSSETRISASSMATCASSSSTIMSMALPACAGCCACSATRRTRRTTVSKASPPPRSSTPTWCCWTSPCRSSMATRSLAGSAQSRGGGTCCSSP